MINAIDFIKIQDSDHNIFNGANQYWLKNRFYAISSCGPTTAAETLAYLAIKHESKCKNLYDYNLKNLNKQQFCDFIVKVRKYVKPSIHGLTDINYYKDRMVAFAKDRDVTLDFTIIEYKSNKQIAFNEIKKAINSGYPVSLLILKNPHAEIKMFTWHWMNIIAYNSDSMHITISTYGKTFLIDFNKVWLESKIHRSKLIWFRPKK